MSVQDLFALFYGVFFASMLSSCFGLSLFQWGWFFESKHKRRRLITSLLLLNIFPGVYFSWVHKNLGGISPYPSYRLYTSIFFLGLSVFVFYRLYHLAISWKTKYFYEQDEIAGKGRYRNLSERLAGVGPWPGQVVSVIFYFGMAYLAWDFGISETGGRMNKPLLGAFLVLSIGSIFKMANNETVQNIFKIITGLVAIFAFIISLQTYKRTVVFGNRPLPKIELKQAQDGIFKIEISNKGKDPLTDTRLLYKIAPVEGNQLIEARVKTGKFCAGLVEQEDSPVIADTRLKIDELQFENKNIFFFIGIHSPSLYGDKYRFEIRYTTIDKGDIRLHRLNENYGALGPEHLAMVKAQERELKNKLKSKRSFHDFCIDA